MSQLDKSPLRASEQEHVGGLQGPITSILKEVPNISKAIGGDLAFLLAYCLSVALLFAWLREPVWLAVSEALGLSVFLILKLTKRL